MKVLISLLVVTVLVSWWLFQTGSGGPQVVTDGMPWQVEPLAGGKSRVFGLVLGDASLADAKEALGAGYELAIISRDRDDAALEMYYTRFLAGPLSGKLVVVADADKAVLKTYMQRASKVSTLQNGTKQFKFNVDDEQLLSAYKVKSLSFVPTVNLDPAMISSRFGEPKEILAVNEQQQHYLYPEKGLGIVVDQEAKELLQYIAPKNFQLLQQPLKQQAVVNKE